MMVRMAKIVLSAVLLVGAVLFDCSCAAGLVKIEEEELRRVIEEFVQRKTDNLGAHVRIKNIAITGKNLVPPGAVEYEIKAPNQWEGWGSVNLAVLVRVDGSLRKNIAARVEVEALVDMVVSTRQLEMGEIVRESDVALQQRDMAGTGRKFYRNIEDVIGKRLKMPVRGNTALRTDQLDKPPLVKSGQIVTILLENDMIRVTATGRARGAGAAGDILIVQNLASQKDIQARVVDSSTVRVEF